MTAAFGVSVLFLACYLAYHTLSGIRTRFPETSWFRPYYLVLLGTHTVLAMVVVPMVLRTVFLAWRGRLEEHRRLARWTFPIWLYVSVTGVLVYLFLYHVFKGG